MKQRTKIALVVGLVAAGMLSAALARAGVAGPPYTDANSATITALGGVGQTYGWKKSAAGGSAWVDLLSAGNIPAEQVASGATTQTTASQVRVVTVKRVSSAGAASGEGVCVAVGTFDGAFDANAQARVPSWSCPDGNAGASASVGGAFLLADGDVFQVTLRPNTACGSYSTCHIAVWARGTTASAGTFELVVTESL